MTRVLITAIALLLAATTASTANADLLPREVHGVIAAITNDGVALRDAGRTTFCKAGPSGNNVRLDIRYFQLAVGQHAVALCFSLDGGATWNGTMIYPDQDNLVSVTGMVLQLAPGEVKIITKDHSLFGCGRTASQFAGISVGRQVRLTCVYTRARGYTVTTVKAASAASAVKTLTVSGTVVALDGDTLLIQGPDFAYDFTIPPDDLARVTAVVDQATVTAVDGGYGTSVTVTARPSGNQWMLVSATLS